MKNEHLFSIETASLTPAAHAFIHGNLDNPSLIGVAKFYETTWHTGLIIEVIFENLPASPTYHPTFLGLHIHEHGDCSMNFANTGMHYNPSDAPHPYHAGDLPSILNSNGYGYLVFYDAFLSSDAVVGRSIVLHDHRDDFSTQPSGDSGQKIACGMISRWE